MVWRNGIMDQVVNFNIFSSPHHELHRLRLAMSKGVEIIYRMYMTVTAGKIILLLILDYIKKTKLMLQFDENWKAQFDQPEWKQALDFYVGMMKESGPAGYATNGFNENLSLFNQGKCGMWIDATVAASFVTGDDSTVADHVGSLISVKKQSYAVACMLTMVLVYISACMLIFPHK